MKNAKMFTTDITNIGDPFVVLYGGVYYLYATSAPDGFKVFTADTLDGRWTDGGYCYKKSETSFGFENFWAPEVRRRNDGKFVMHYTARWTQNKSLRCGVAVADGPTGPFTDVRPNEPMFDPGFAVIDAHCFCDEDGKNYLYYVRDVSENIRDGVRYSDIYVSELNGGLTEVVSAPRLVLEPSQAWEKLHSAKWLWNEGPFVIKHGGLYYLMYSANCFDSKFYGVGYAVADSPFGPFLKADENPILENDSRMSGPGHNAVFTGKDGKLYTAFHIHTHPETPSGDRRVCFTYVKFDGKKLVFE